MPVELFENLEALARGAALFIVRAAVRDAAERGRFAVALSGGNTPLTAYRLLGRPPLVGEMPWPAVHLFWGDERCVPPEHAQSNYRAAMAALGPPAGLPAGNIHRIPAEEGPQKGAALYEDELGAFFGRSGLPEFDLVLLGLGGDGHTASLFPDSPALQVRDRSAAGGDVPDHAQPRLARVTLTLPVINKARRVLFLVSGAGKAAVVKAIFKDASGAARDYPGAMIKPAGELSWFLDRSAARGLPVI